MTRRSAKPLDSAERVEVRSVNSPRYRSTLQKGKYEAMRKALLKVLPGKAPGLTQNEMFVRVVPHLPDSLFPNGEKAPWWVKAVQLDLEARGVVVREATKPLRWHRA